MYVRTCTAYDPVTDTCSAEAWALQPSFLPEMSAQDGFEVSAAIVGVWGLCYCLRLIARFIWR